MSPVLCGLSGGFGWLVLCSTSASVFMLHRPETSLDHTGAITDPLSVELITAHNLLLYSHSLVVSSIVGRRARALYACKAEHDSELSFIAGTIFENGESGSKLASRSGGGVWAAVFLGLSNDCSSKEAASESCHQI